MDINLKSINDVIVTEIRSREGNLVLALLRLGTSDTTERKR
jgi:hypothetical protein